VTKSIPHKRGDEPRNITEIPMKQRQSFSTFFKSSKLNDSVESKKVDVEPVPAFDWLSTYAGLNLTHQNNKSSGVTVVNGKRLNVSLTLTNNDDIHVNVSSDSKQYSRTCGKNCWMRAYESVVYGCETVL
jgi:hypothetical protein